MNKKTYIERAEEILNEDNTFTSYIALEALYQLHIEGVREEKQFNEIRTRKGELDDIAIYDMHLEDMTGNVWWLGYYRGNKRTTFNIRSKTKIKLEVIENELKSKMVEQELVREKLKK